LLFGLLKYLIKRLPSVQNASARLVTGTRKFDHITPVLIYLILRWLPVDKRKTLLFHRTLKNRKRFLDQQDAYSKQLLRLPATRQKKPLVTGPSRQQALDIFEEYRIFVRTKT
jgi:hypothetical protein